jgi:hypothetical protein
MMTWASFGSRLLNLAFVLPLVLTRLPAPEISVFLLFRLVVALQLLVDFGFGSTFARVIAYALGGVREAKDFGIAGAAKSPKEAHWDTVARIWTVMRVVYGRLALLAFALTATLGTAAVLRPIALASHERSAWLAWIIVVCTSAAPVLANKYAAYLQGLDEIASFRRWEAIFGLGAAVSSALVLFLGGGLLALVGASQAWVFASLWRNRWLATHVAEGRLTDFEKVSMDREVFEAVWPSAWRSGVGVLMSFGVIQISGVAYAQFAQSVDVAAYLVALRVIQAISDFSRAPFYSKMPRLARFRSQGMLSDQLQLARRGMQLAYASFLVAFIAAGVLGPTALVVIGSNAPFVQSGLWSLLGIAFLFERYGAMHLQLYSTTHHITWHVANTVGGGLFLVLSVALVPALGVYAFPIAYLAGYGGFYAPYAARLSYRAGGARFLQFESAAFIPALAIMLVYTVVRQSI